VKKSDRFIEEDNVFGNFRSMSVLMLFA